MIISDQNIKKPLGYIVRNRKGYQSDLKKYDVYIKSFKTVGFINTGHTLKADTYSVTDLADNYYKDLFGRTSYYNQRILGFLDKLLKKV
ncbi:hypothetical protein IJ674_09030 [bacterium]|nr:hypothetical protein [bacterium]